MKFSELLTFYRERQGLTKTQIAEKLGVSAEYVINIENNSAKRPPTLERCQQIARVLSLSLEETQSLVDASMIERLSQDELEWIMARCPDHFQEYASKKIVKK